MKSKKIEKNIDVENFYIPRWEELPSIDLYLDQIVTVLEKYLQNHIGKKEDKIITKTMINNYVKYGILKPPVKKKYNKEHIARLFVICILKQIYSISDIDELIKLAISRAEAKKAYNKFCICLEKSISYIFDGEEYIDDENMVDADYLLKHVVLSFANNLYVKKKFLSQ